MGLAVVPIFAGFDERRGRGRLWDFDVTGGRYEEREYVATGSGSLHAGTVVKLGWRDGLDRDAAIDLACRALWEAADADSATGGPDALRGDLPDRRHDHGRRLRAASTTPTRGALRAHRRDARSRGGRAGMSMPFYVAPEQVMKDRADYARKGIARGRALVALRYDDGIAIVAENSSETLRKVSEIYDRIAFAGVGALQRVRPAARRRRPGRGPQGVPVQPRRRRRPQPGQPVRPDPRPDLHPRDEADGGRDPRRRGRRDAGRRPDVPHPVRRHRVRPQGPHGARRRRRRHPGRLSESFADGLDAGAAVRAGVAALAGPDRTLAGRGARGRRCWLGATGAAASGASTTTRSPPCSPRRLARRARRRPAPSVRPEVCIVQGRQTARKAARLGRRIRALRLDTSVTVRHAHL